jgi:hypothetical protein
MEILFVRISCYGVQTQPGRRRTKALARILIPPSAIHRHVHFPISLLTNLGRIYSFFIRTPTRDHRISVRLSSFPFRARLDAMAAADVREMLNLPAEGHPRPHKKQKVVEKRPGEFRYSLVLLVLFESNLAVSRRGYHP